MKIWFASNIADNAYGGVGRSMRGLAAALKARGHDVTIICRPAGMPDNFLLFALYLFLRFCARIFNRPDWIIARSTDGVLCAIASRLLRLTTKIALHNHGWEEHVEEFERRLPRCRVTSPTTWKARLVRFSLLRLTLAASHACICGTVWEIRWLKRKYPHAYNRFAYIPNGVEPQASAYWTHQDHAPLHFLCVGAPTWKKNLPHSIAVFSRVRKHYPAAKLFLVGTGTAPMAGILPAGDFCSDAISIIPSVPWDGMRLWYTTCPFLIASPRFEGGHSLAILEALSYGAVVFVSPIPSTLEFVRDGRNGCVITGSDVEIDAARIIGVLADAGSLAAIRMNAYLTAHRHRWARQAARLEACLCRRK